MRQAPRGNLLGEARRAGLISPDRQPEDATAMIAILREATVPPTDELVGS